MAAALSQLEELVRALMSPDNDTRKAAETAFDGLSQDCSVLISSMFQILTMSTATEVHPLAPPRPGPMQPPTSSSPTPSLCPSPPRGAALAPPPLVFHFSSTYLHAAMLSSRLFSVSMWPCP